MAKNEGGRKIFSAIGIGLIGVTGLVFIILGLVLEPELPLVMRGARAEELVAHQADAAEDKRAVSQKDQLDAMRDRKIQQIELARDRQFLDVPKQQEPEFVRGKEPQAHAKPLFPFPHLPTGMN